jgi:hypothetical protein
LFQKFAKDSLTEMDSLKKMQDTFNYYGGEIKAVETGKVFCEFMRDNYPLSQDFSFMKEDFKSNEDKYLIFITENASQVSEYFSNGDTVSISNTLKGKINSNTHDGIEAIAWGITFASVRVYCPEYKPIFFIK